VRAGPLVGILCGRSPAERSSTHGGCQYEPVHAVRAVPGSDAARALADAEQVKSIHHQAVADPGQALRATAWSDDGVIGTVEAPGLLGVQCHPERLSAGDPLHLAAFHWLVAP
jgi:putative glutamine amidotransferase